MRLGTFFLTLGLTVAAQQPPKALPWASARALPWDAEPCIPANGPALAPVQTALPLSVRVSQDGAIRIIDDKGSLRLRMGLPGRPLKFWRDWGIPLELSASPLAFPAHTPLLGGIGALPVGSADFRPALEGLLWILDDDEKVITLIHPATARVVYLPLPGGRNLSLLFLPDKLEVQENPVAADAPATCWSIPWLALLPQFIQLGQLPNRHRNEGTVMLPFPKE